MKDKTLRLLIAFFLLISVVLVVVASLAVRNINRSTRDNDWVNHTHAVVSQIDTLRTTLYMAEVTAKAYIADGLAENMASCNQALAHLSEHAQLLADLTRYETDQHQLIEEIGGLTGSHVEKLESILTLREDGQTAPARAKLSTLLSGPEYAKLTHHIERLKEIALELLSERDTAVYLQAETMRWTVWSGVILDVMLLIGAAWVIRDALRARQSEARALHILNTELQTRVDERTAELSAANQQLTIENLERQWTNQVLEHQLHYNRNIIDSISDLVLVLTKAVKISRLNPAVLHLTGWDAADLINQSLTRVLLTTTTEAGPDLESRLGQSMKEGRDLRDQPAVLVARNEQRSPVRFSLFPLRDQNKVIGGIVILQIVPPGSEAKAETTIQPTNSEAT
jgi:CHASE3 domain sensor protein